ncbi:hypothetical protein BB560_002826 [Smittium megazygosporum]|uniref:ribose-phosphate diphosphokinase n=1 Tax=Smittium megazygosporum TaxID=133381 RepID=A0A2T9ZDN6_9FUNG|nr:hypothetical protein BB560_002826 [Smittium megazygosporum]
MDSPSEKSYRESQTAISGLGRRVGQLDAGQTENAEYQASHPDQILQRTFNMRNALLFAGTSHPDLAKKIAAHLNMPLSPVTVRRYPNQELTVNFGCSVRSQSVYIVQSGSDTINDHVMELMIMVRAARAASASSVIVIMPYYSYSKQCKKKKHRGAIAAKLVADMLMVAGVNHVITLDLHAKQISGFFTVPLDNLFSKPIFVNWIKRNIPNYQDAVVVSKNIGGAKRVTVIADDLQMRFALIFTESKHVKAMKKGVSIVALHQLGDENTSPTQSQKDEVYLNYDNSQNNSPPLNDFSSFTISNCISEELKVEEKKDQVLNDSPGFINPSLDIVDSAELDLRPMDEIMNESDDDLEPSVVIESHQSRDPSYEPHKSIHFSTSPSQKLASLHHGKSISFSVEPSSGLKHASHFDSKHSKPPVKNKEVFTTLIGDVSGRAVLLVDDLIDSPKSFLSVAEHLVKECGATRVYICVSHGLFTEAAARDIDACKYITNIITTNSYPISQKLRSSFKKLVQVDVSHLLAEAIRRNHNGESISALFEKIV